MITAAELEQLGFTTEQTPNKCTVHHKGEFRILLFDDGSADLQKKYRNDWPKIVTLTSIEHLQILWFGLTGERLE